MRKKFKWKLIAFFATVASLLLLGGCKFQPSLDERREKYDLPVSVTYYTNGSGAYFGSNTTEKTLYLPDGAVAMNIGVDTVVNGSMPTPTRNNYTLIGWYEAEIDEEGKPLKDENGEVVLKTDAFDFKRVLKDGDAIKLYAKWQKKESIYVYLVCDEITPELPFTISKNGQAVTVEDKGLLTEYPYYTDGICQEPTERLIPSASGYTMVDFYADEACTQKVAWPLAQEEYGDYNIYAKYVKGEWLVLSEPSDVSKLFLPGKTRSFYLANDIDCTGVTVSPIANNFTSTLNGNGHTISNLTVDAGTVGRDVTEPPTLSTFGNIKEGAAIKDVTFDGITFKCTLASNKKANIYGLYASIENLSSIEKVTLKNVSFDLTCRNAEAYCLNMYVGDDSNWKTTRVLFGGTDTDAEQIAAGLDVNIDEAKITIYVNKNKVS